MLESSTPESLEKITTRDQSVNELLQDENFSGDWALRLASMIQASITSEVSDSVPEEAAMQTAIDAVKQIPNAHSPAALFNHDKEQPAKDNSSAEQNLGLIFLKAAEMACNKHADPAAINIAKEMATNAIKLINENKSRLKTKSINSTSKSNTNAKYSIGINELKPGMITVEKICTNRGATVIPANTILTSSLINNMHLMQVNSTQIREPIVVQLAINTKRQ